MCASLPVHVDHLASTPIWFDQPYGVFWFKFCDAHWNNEDVLILSLLSSLKQLL